MAFIALSAVCSVLLGFIFKVFPRFGVDSFQAIVFNYMTCIFCGWLHLGHFPVNETTMTAPWTPYALVLGLVFVSGFNCTALTVRYFGVTISQIMQKMSILMTVPFAILIYHESSGWAKMIGFLMALGSIVLVNWPSDTDENSGKRPKSAHRFLYVIPFLTWFLAGIIEVLFVLVQKESMILPNDPSFVIFIFGTAGVIGLTIAMVGWFSGRLLFSWKNIVGGIVLGIPNYGSMLFLLLALGTGLEGSFVFSITNVSIILITTIGAVAFFQERLSKMNWLGIALALGAIGMISM
jgi:drug/metabolite transporter (DMT)-like permease